MSLGRVICSTIVLEILYSKQPMSSINGFDLILINVLDNLYDKQMASLQSL